MKLLKVINKKSRYLVLAIPIYILAACGGGSGNQTSGAVNATGAPQVILTIPVKTTPPITGIATNLPLTAKFNQDMMASTLNASAFTVGCPAGAPIGGTMTVTYDTVNRVAVLQHANAFPQNTTCQATITSAVKNTAGIAMAENYVWSFTTGGGNTTYGDSSSSSSSVVNLRSISAYGGFGGGAGATNQGVNTLVSGNMGTTGVCTTITGFHDATNIFTETPLNVGQVTGTIFCGPPAPGTVASLALATQAQADAELAYIELRDKPGAITLTQQLGGVTLAPGVYKSAAAFDITSGNLTLDAGGDSNASWIFQVPSALTVGAIGTPRNVVLINGALASNVFWQVGAAATINQGCTMIGTIIANSGLEISTAGALVQTTLIGRAISLIASVTMVNTTVTLP